jgi:hypothetical protein
MKTLPARTTPVGRGTLHIAFRLGLHAWRRKNIKTNLEIIKKVRKFVLK